LKSLLLSTSFVGAGVGCFVAGRSILAGNADLDWRTILAMLQVLGAAPLIGAGILGPFGRARLGAYLGFFAFVTVGLGYDTYHFGWNAISQSPMYLAVIGATAFAMSMAIFVVCRRTLRRRTKQPISENPISD